MIETEYRQARQAKRRPRLSVYQRLIDHVFRPMHRGRLTITLPDGHQLIYGNGNGVEADVRVVRNDFFKKCVLFGDVGFGEAYVDGDWETSSIERVIEWMILNVENHPTLVADTSKRTPVNVLKAFNNMMSWFRKNSVYGSRKNIQYHYDLGNDFYRILLDPSMTYSAAYFTDRAQSLEEAQYAKYARLCTKLQLKSTDHLLEIGTGWGGFAVYAAKNFNCRVTTVTISKEQHAYAVQRVAREGLAHKITVELKDYRALEGVYDKIASIEMLEAVGHEYYAAYFSKCHELLKKDGILALQVIMSPDHRYDFFRKNTDWIQKHIFPGSLLPSLAVIQKNINQTGTLNLHHFEEMTGHYVRTLQMWRDNLNRNADRVLGLRFDSAFLRKWNYYLAYCEAAFHTRNISVAQAVYVRPNVIL